MDLSSHAALFKKRKISDSSAFVWCAERLYTLLMHDGKEEKERKRERKKEIKKEGKKKEQNFFDCEEKSWDSGAILYIYPCKNR